MLPGRWSVGMVLMEMNCPEYYRTDLGSLEGDVEGLARLGGRRLIITDRFAVNVGSELRKRGVRLAERLGLRMQTHLNEQDWEKTFVEKTLYPGRGTYTDVYAQDGLLGREAIMAHCVKGSIEEMRFLRDYGASVAHCATSNALLGSGVMRLDWVKELGIDYAICTDVGASPTTSLWCEMAVFLKVHAGESAFATGCEAFYRTTLGAAGILGLEGRYGSWEKGKSMTFCEMEGEIPLVEGLKGEGEGPKSGGKDGGEGGVKGGAEGGEDVGEGIGLGVRMRGESGIPLVKLGGGWGEESVGGNEAGRGPGDGLALPGVGGRVEDGDVEAEAVDDVVVDEEVEGNGSGAAGEFVGGDHFGPDAGVEEFDLVAGDDPGFLEGGVGDGGCADLGGPEVGGGEEFFFGGGGRGGGREEGGGGVGEGGFEEDLGVLARDEDTVGGGVNFGFRRSGHEGDGMQEARSIQLGL